MKYLIVSAHPADAALAAGASIYIWTHFGKTVDICSLSTDSKVNPSSHEKDNLNVCADFLGVSAMYEHAFPNTGLNTVPRGELIHAIEGAIAESRPDIVITHNPSDPDRDHLLTSIACREAVRKYIGQPDSKPIKELWYMEIPSAADDTADRTFNKFSPNCFIEVGEAGIEAKLKAMSLLNLSPIRDSSTEPKKVKPVTPEFLRRYAAARGKAYGLKFAEAFQIHHPPF